jgi:hypothetical protein
VCGSRLQRADDEKPADDRLNVARMSREKRDRLKRKLAEQFELAEQPRVAM